MLALRAPSVAAAAGIAALLAFGTGNRDLVQIATVAASYNQALSNFFFAIVLGCAAPAVAWCCQNVFNFVGSKTTLTWRSPYFETPQKWNWLLHVGIALKWLAALVVLMSIFFVGKGAISFYEVAASLTD